MVDMISVKELRKEFPRVKKELEKGNSFILIYRSQPLAELKPYKPERKKLFAKGLFSLLTNPPKSLLFRSKKSSVQLVRDERK